MSAQLQAPTPPRRQGSVLRRPQPVGDLKVVALRLVAGAVLLMSTYGRRRATRVAAVALYCVPVVVGLSRLYRGMHYPSDVLVGALGGGLWLLLVITTLLPRRRAADPAPAP